MRSMQHFTYKYWSTTQTKERGGNFDTIRKNTKKPKPKPIFFKESSRPLPPGVDFPSPSQPVLLLPRTATRSSPTEPLTPLNQITAAPIHFLISLFLGPNQPPHSSPYFLANNTKPFPFDFLLPQPLDASLPSTLSISLFLPDSRP